MNIALVILMLLAVPVLLCAGAVLHAFVLMKKWPVRAWYDHRRRQADFTPLSRIPQRLTELLVELEDSDYYRHRGVTLSEIRYAVKLNLRAKKIVYGGSTISMQLAKNLYFRFTHNYLRKISEVIIALRMEKVLGKERLLELYINIIYFGNGRYGITDAARFYFSRRVNQLTLNQMFMLACIPPVPTRGNPIQYPDVFERIRNRRLKYILREKNHPLITPEESGEIFARHADCLDPDLRKPDDFTRSYPRTIPLINERFGRFGRERP